MDDLEAKLKESSHLRSRIIVTDGSFSMDGTIAQLDKICDLADKYDAAVMVDDSHSSGFMGKTGRGTHEYRGVMGRIDIITGTLGKALGGGMPLGAFIADKKLMATLTSNPELGHITTFGGHPVCCAAGMTAMKVLLEEKLIHDVKKKENLFHSLLINPKIKAIRSFGLWLAVEFDSFETNKRIIDACIQSGVLTDWFLFSPQSLRISPPLNISDELIVKACEIILRSCNS